MIRDHSWLEFSRQEASKRLKNIYKFIDEFKIIKNYL